jgi:hypothetical protein
MSGFDRTDTRPVDEDLLDLTIHHVIVTGDVASLARVYPSAADRFRAGLRAALHEAIANGLLAQTPVGSWPDTLVTVPAEHDIPGRSRT